MVSQTDRGLHHEAARVAAAGLLCLSGLTGTLLLVNAIGVPPWVTVPGALTWQWCGAFCSVREPANGEVEA